MSRRVAAHVRGNAVAYTALFVALGGTGAYAAGSIGANEIASDAVQARHIERSAVGGSEIENGTVKAKDLDEGAAPGLPAVAFAHVSQDATLDQGLSENVDSVTQPNPGAYCFDLAEGTNARNVVATRSEEANQNTPAEIVTDVPATDALGLADCPAGSRDAFVGFRTTDAAVNAAFFVVFH